MRRTDRLAFRCIMHHFFYDDLGYKGIVSPGGENYYSYQEKNIVFIHLSSEHPNRNKQAWVQQIIDSVKADPSS